MLNVTVTGISDGTLPTQFLCLSNPLPYVHLHKKRVLCSKAHRF